jgi:Cu2+-containing amine oxidase
VRAGDPNYPYIRKCAMDCGDYGMGFVANSLQLGCDCLGHIKYFDGVVNNAQVRVAHAASVLFRVFVASGWVGAVGRDTSSTLTVSSTTHR